MALVAHRASEESVSVALLAGIGLSSAAGILGDSGLGTYLLATDRLRSRIRFITGSLMHLIFAGAAQGSAVVIWLLSSESFDPSLLSALICFGIAQSFESLTRAVRGPLLKHLGPVAYSIPELLNGLFRAALVAVGLLLASPLSLLYLTPIGPVIVASVVACVVSAIPQRRTGVTKDSLLGILPYGMAQNVSAMYSQAPIFVSGLVLPQQQTALLAIVYRAVQPTEIVPATLSQQLLPTLASATKDRLTRLRRQFALMGIGAFIALAAASPFLALLFATPPSTYVPLLLLASCSLPLKFRNYLLATFLTAAGHVKQRLKIALVCAAAALPIVAAAGAMAESYGIVTATIAIEFLLGTLLAHQWRGISKA